MKRLLFLVALVSLVTLSGFWGAKKMCLMMWPGSLNPSQSWYYSLGLTPEQEASLKKIDALFRTKGDKLCMRICGERLGLLNLIRGKDPDRRLIHQKIEEIGRLQVELEKMIAEHILKVKNGLTPAQSEAYLHRVHEELAGTIQKLGYGEALKQID